MFLASSEIAVATTARSVVGNPHCDAKSRPFWRAETMSASQSMDTRTSSAMSANLMARTLPLAVKVREALFQVQRGCDPLPGPDPADRHDQRVPQLLQVLVGERGLHRRDQIGALLEDRNLHEPLAAATRSAPWAAPASARPCTPAGARPPRCRPGDRRP